jgi:Ca-activated chloride channel family protein
MTWIDNFHFLRPAWLLLLPVSAWLWWWVRRSQDPLRGWRAVMHPQLLAAMMVGPATRQRWRGVTVLLTWLIAVVAVAGPTWRPEPSPFADDPIPVMLVLKAGESMEIADLPPSRMERARLKVADFADQRRGQPLGLIAYAGSAHLVLPPTRDTTVVATMAGEISPAIMPRPGDDLAAALRLAEQTLGHSGGSIVVIADTVSPGWQSGGGDNVAGAGDGVQSRRLPVHFWAVALADTPEFDALGDAASRLRASVTRITPDASDVDALLRRTSARMVAVAGDGDAARWAEAGWWLTPVLALFSLSSFRKVVNDPLRDAGADQRFDGVTEE